MFHLFLLPVMRVAYSWAAKPGTHHRTRAVQDSVRQAGPDDFEWRPSNGRRAQVRRGSRHTAGGNTGATTASCKLFGPLKLPPSTARMPSLHSLEFLKRLRRRSLPRKNVDLPVRVVHHRLRNARRRAERAGTAASSPRSEVGWPAGG
ncbi:hypothetical protein DFH06DRAFT_1335246 [Mycena polygramma]|nr:hypothetical protein DFH06DRAFT_1335246 [Mycena polygramma]